MSVDLNGMIEHWSTVRAKGSALNALALRAQEAYIDKDGKPVAPPAGTITDIKAEAALIIPEYEAAVAAHKAAYMP